MEAALAKAGYRNSAKRSIRRSDKEFDYSTDRRCGEADGMPSRDSYLLDKK
jgi:hypothetical protein